MKYRFLLAYAVLSLVMSAVVFLAYGVDKRRAQNGGWRVPEARLHWLSLLGGWPGALLGQRVFRHKTGKFSFLLVFWAIVAVQLCGILAIVLLT